MKTPKQILESGFDDRIWIKKYPKQYTAKEYEKLLEELK